MRLATVVSFLILSCAFGCASAPEPEPQMTWAIAIHGGAGTMDPDSPRERLKAYEDALTRALVLGKGMLTGGSSALVANLPNNPQQAGSSLHFQAAVVSGADIVLTNSSSFTLE